MGKGASKKHAATSLLSFPTECARATRRTNWPWPARSAPSPASSSSTGDRGAVRSRKLLEGERDGEVVAKAVTHVGNGARVDRRGAVHPVAKKHEGEGRGGGGEGGGGSELKSTWCYWRVWLPRKAAVAEDRIRGAG